jgi:hypothetical protein
MVIDCAALVVSNARIPIDIASLVPFVGAEFWAQWGCAIVAGHAGISDFGSLVAFLDFG